MPKDDQAFFADMQAADRDFQTATADALLLQIESQAALSRLSQIREFYGCFHELGRISGGTEPVIKSIELQMLPRLKKYEHDNSYGPIEVIKEKLKGWQGPEGSASYRFKNNYLNGLGNAMDTQYSIMKAMADLMRIHEAVIDQARAKYLDLINNTTKAIGQNTSERESIQVEAVVDVVNSISTGVQTGGPLGVILGVVGGVGAVIDAVDKEAIAGDWYTITDDTLGKLGAIVGAVKEEAGKVERGLDQVLTYVDGDRNDFLTPKVNLGS